MPFLLRCPRCGNNMKYQPQGLIQDKIKKCVYCGFNMTARNCIIKRVE